MTLGLTHQLFQVLLFPLPSHTCRLIFRNTSASYYHGYLRALEQGNCWLLVLVWCEGRERAPDLQAASSAVGWGMQAAGLCHSVSALGCTLDLSGAGAPLYRGYGSLAGLGQRDIHDAFPF